MKMAHVFLFFASISEENSRSRFSGGNFLTTARKRPAIATVRALIFACKRIFEKLKRRWARSTGYAVEKFQRYEQTFRLFGGPL
jgi:hypothetical protein